MQLPITVKLQPSRNLAVLLIAMHVGAAVVVSSVGLLVWVKLALLSLVVISAWHSRKCWYGAQRIVSLSLRDKGALAYVRMNGEAAEASVDRQSTVTPCLTVILLRSGKPLETLVLLPDALNQGDYRRLRVWLRWQSASH